MGNPSKNPRNASFSSVFSPFLSAFWRSFTTSVLQDVDAAEVELRGAEARQNLGAIAHQQGHLKGSLHHIYIVYIYDVYMSTVLK